MNPEKQGLKQEEYLELTAKPGYVVEVNPEKQGLKLRQRQQAGRALSCRRSESRKTRIETSRHRNCPQHARPVVEVNPEKQGLKPGGGAGGKPYGLLS